MWSWIWNGGARGDPEEVGAKAWWVSFANRSRVSTLVWGNSPSTARGNYNGSYSVAIALQGNVASSQNPCPPLLFASRLIFSLNFQQDSKSEVQNTIHEEERLNLLLCDCCSLWSRSHSGNFGHWIGNPKRSGSDWIPGFKWWWWSLTTKDKVDMVTATDSGVKQQSG